MKKKKLSYNYLLQIKRIISDRRAMEKDYENRDKQLELDIINSSYCKNWCIEINKKNWKKHEPAEMKPEKPIWLRQNILRAISEGIITQEEANGLLDEEIKIKKPRSLKEKQGFIRLSLEERRRILAKQAEKIADVYEYGPDAEDFQGGDIVDY